MGFYEGRYVEVNWEPEHFFQRWGMRAPARFGLCIPKKRCKDAAMKWLLLPMLWAYVHHGPQVNYQDLPHILYSYIRTWYPLLLESFCNHIHIICAHICMSRHIETARRCSIGPSRCLGSHLVDPNCCRAPCSRPFAMNIEHFKARSPSTTVPCGSKR